MGALCSKFWPHSDSERKNCPRASQPQFSIENTVFILLFSVMKGICQAFKNVEGVPFILPNAIFCILLKALFYIFQVELGKLEFANGDLWDFLETK